MKYVRNVCNNPIKRSSVNGYRDCAKEKERIAIRNVVMNILICTERPVSDSRASVFLSSLAWDTNYNSAFRDFTQFLQTHAAVVPLFCDCFLPHSLHLFHTVQDALAYWQCSKTKNTQISCIVI